MKQIFIAGALVSSGLLISAVAMAQTTSNGQPAEKPAVAQKQRTDGGADPSSQYNFSTPGGQYSARPAIKQRTDGEDVTGNNNFPAASK